MLAHASCRHPHVPSAGQQCAADGLWYACDDPLCAHARFCSSNLGLHSCACPAGECAKPMRKAWHRELEVAAAAIKERELQVGISHSRGVWLRSNQVRNKTFACCDDFRKRSTVCAPLNHMAGGVHGDCSCDPPADALRVSERELYDWVPHDAAMHLPDWDPDAFCSALGEQRVVFIGDSTVDQARGCRSPARVTYPFLPHCRTTTHPPKSTTPPHGHAAQSSTTLASRGHRLQPAWPRAWVGPAARLASSGGSQTR